MFDIAQIVLWGITYLLIVYFMLKNRSKKIKAIPLLPVILNMSWEINALIESNGFWGHIVWLGLDIFVFICCTMCIKTIKNQVLYVLSLIPGTILLRFCFLLDKGMLMSSFAIDLIMAICFWVERKKLLTNGKVAIGITKLLGDLMAASYYAPHHLLIIVIGIAVFCFNSAYVISAIKERNIIQQNSKIEGKSVP